jgi:hypothetical protein
MVRHQGPKDFRQLKPKTNMTRQETLNAYSVNEHGTITSPGKFEGEPIFAPLFWSIGLDGCADSDDGKVYTFHIRKTDPEHQQFPELAKWLGRRRTLRLREDNQGFVHCF